MQVILEGGELWLFAQTKWAVLLIQAVFQGERERILVTRRIRAMRKGNEMVSSLYDRVTLINRDGNMRDQYNYFEVFRLD
ncbi:hypothetical protein [Methanothrix sp.]|uniref:hypothetical protein n=1 Tax=Methanothrix sp. TaxID=90426 RepID=UPI0027B0CCD7|nr:hypothetical protein [Euryarchaeota archaeon]